MGSFKALMTLPGQLLQVNMECFQNEILSTIFCYLRAGFRKNMQQKLLVGDNNTGFCFLCHLLSRVHLIPLAGWQFFPNLQEQA